MTDNRRVDAQRPAPRDEEDRNALRFISMKEVCRRIGYTPQHVRRLIAAGAFPSYVPLGANKIGFIEAEVTAWQREKIAQRDARRAQQGDGQSQAAPAPGTDSRRSAGNGSAA
jgi:prophage regulatory protein